MRLPSVLTIVIVLAFASVAFGQQADFYVYQGKPLQLKSTEQYLSIVLNTPPSERLQQEILRAFAGRRGIDLGQPLTVGNVWLLGLKGTSESVAAFLKDVRSHPAVEFAFPARTYGPTLLFLSNEVLVRYRGGVGREQIRKINEKFGVAFRQIFETAPVYRLTLSKKSTILDPLIFAGQYVKDLGDVVEFASPNFFRTIRLFREPDDPYYPKQWTLKAINAPAGWDRAVGDDASNIAVLDDGVDTRHPDLRIKDGYDAVTDRSGQKPNPWDGHGTAVAGLAAAVGNNGKGVTGVVWRGSLIAIRVLYSDVGSDGARRVITTDEWLARGIRGAYMRGADVLVMAWGSTAPSDPVRDALEEADQRGRNGRGCVLVAAAGNDPKVGVQFPANLPKVISVGAVDPSGKRWPYSPAGQELSVVAPSGDVPKGDVWTTDQVGSDGLAPGDYYENFGGTSASAGLVGGLAGLILTVNRNLKAADVKDIIQTTADDLGTTGRDDEYGYGRINVGQAIQAAQRRR